MLNKATTERKLTRTVLMSCVMASMVLMSCGGANTEPAKMNIDLAAKTAEAPAEKKTEDPHYQMADLVDLDLSANGFPLIIKAPKGAKVSKSGMLGSLGVDGGKNFQITIAKNDGTDAEYMHTSMKKMAATPESMFAKFELEDKLGFIKKDTQGRFLFQYYVDAGKELSYMVTESLPIDVSAEPVTYSLDDIKVMFEAAKASTVKK